MRKALIPLLLFAGACLTPVHPDVSLEPGVSLKSYRVFVVGPVVDHTGAPFDVNVTDSLRVELARRLQSHGLSVVTKPPPDTTSGVLVITSALIQFRGMSIQTELPGPGGADTMCRLAAELRDGQTGRHLGEIVASDMGGRTPLTVLNECAHDLGDEIYRQQRRT